MRERLTRTVALMLALVAGIAVVLVAADAFVREQMREVGEQVARSALRLDADDDLRVRIEGGSAIVQLIMGDVEHVIVDAPDVGFGSLVGDVHLEIFGLPTNEVSPIGRSIAYVSFDQDDVGALAAASLATDALGLELDPPVVYVQAAPARHLGLRQNTYWLRTEPALEAGSLRLAITGAIVDGVRLGLPEASAALQIDLAARVQAPGVCLLERLPLAMPPHDVRVSSGAVVVALGGQQISVLDMLGPHTGCTD